MDVLIKNGTVITGDGSTSLPKAHVWIRDGRIEGVSQGDLPEHPDVAKTIDAVGALVIPGVINHHTHGCTEGPSMPSGSPRLPRHEVLYLLNRHLLEGTTTLLNVCGLALMDEIRELRRIHPINLHIATAHTPANVGAAVAVDGSGLTKRHMETTVDEAISAGARAIGEMGGGQTLGGGAQDYKFIPDAIERLSGVRIHPLKAKELKIAVLGTDLSGTSSTSEGVAEAIQSAGLQDKMTEEDVRRAIRESVLPPIQQALDGFREGAAAAERTGYPAIYHNSTPTADLLVQLAERHPNATMIAGHSNHNMFSADESLRYARLLRERGAVIDVSTLDCIHTLWRNDPVNLDALANEGLIDTISTDYAGGHWDSILAAVHRMYVLKQSSLPAAVAMATGNVASAMPQLADGRGLLERGKVADVLISDGANVSRVRHVLIGGSVVVENGALLSPVRS